MKYHNILLDADGTLLDFALAEHCALADTLKHFSLPETEEVHQSYSEANAEQWALLEKKHVTRAQLKINRFQNFCDRIGVSRNAADMAEFYENALSTKGFLLDGAEDICRVLSAHCSLYIVTNGFLRIQTGRFSRSPLSQYLKGIFISEEIGIEKPDPQYFERVAAQIPDFSKETAIIVGDSLSSDIQGGSNFGIDTCWFNPAGKECPPHVAPTYTITSLSQLRNIVL